MKRLFCLFFAGILFFSARGQSFEAQQLLLNWEKLARLREILDNMYKGYQVVSKGYTTIRDISQGNFSLHKGFFDSLLQVSPTVKQYRRVVQTITNQKQMVQEQAKAFAHLKTTGSFSPEEIAYLGSVYSKLLQQCANNLDELILVVTAGQLRMSDSERLQAIDRIYFAVEEKRLFLRAFNNSNTILAMQRKSEAADVAIARKLQNLK